MKLKNCKAVKGLIQYQDRFLVIKREDFIGGEYEVPGGRKLSPEEDDETALKREIMEEVGLEVEILRLLNKWSLDLPEKGIHLDGKTYLCKSISNQIKLGNEHNSYLWVLKEELENLSVPSWLKEAISKLYS